MTAILDRALQHPRWAVEKAYLWGRSTIELRADDIILAFFPKTGSTWVRIFLYNLLTQNGARVDFSFEDLDRDMPEFANPSFFNPWRFASTPRLIKTHSPYRGIFRRNRAVVFAREPRDTMISFLHYANASQKIGFSGDLHDIAHDSAMGLDSYFRFYNSWLRRAGLVIRYEDLRADPAHEFRRLVEFIGIPFNDGEIARALEASSLDRTRRAQARSSDGFKSQFSEGFNFAREGKVGTGRQQFDEELETLLKEKRRHYEFDLYS